VVRLHAVVEGQTEETFVNQVLVPHLGANHIFVDAHRVTTGRKRGRLHRGGISHYDQLKNDLIRWMKQEQSGDVRFTTMIDLYRLPDNFPRYKDCRKNIEPYTRVQCLEDALRSDVADQRLIPYIQLHEFEALLFSEISVFGAIFPEQDLQADLQKVCDAFPTPEHINENPGTSPSARILQLLPDYVKPVGGLLIAQRIGLDRLRAKCKHFSDWLARLEQL
jgi:hypothetical protein